MNGTHRSEPRPDTRSTDDDRGDRTRQTPATDMQAEDTGTAASGDVGARGTPAEAAMKQEHKTKHEGGSRGG